MQHLHLLSSQFLTSLNKKPVKCLQYVHLSQRVIKSNTLTHTSLQKYWQRNEIFEGVNPPEGGDWKHFHISGKEYFNFDCYRNPVWPSCVPDNTFDTASLSRRMNFCHWFYCKIGLIHCTHRLLYSNDNFCFVIAITNN